MDRSTSFNYTSKIHFIIIIIIIIITTPPSSSLSESLHFK